MASYCKIFNGFLSIIPENPSFYRNKHNDIKREMRSSREQAKKRGYILFGGDIIIH